MFTPTKRMDTEARIIRVRIEISHLCKETIVFELDSTLITSTYKKHHMFGGYDASTYVKPIQGQNSKFKLYISYRSYMVDMLTQLK
jgi:hypothetical protein